MNASRVQLGEVADFINGVAFKPDDWGDAGKRIIRIQNLTDPTKQYNLTNREVAQKYEVHPGDLLVSWSATLGVFVWQGPDTALVNQHIFRVIPDLDRVDSGYLRHMLEDALIEMERHLHGATMKHVNRREFLSTTIPLPPLAEQKRIAGILDAADALRAKRRESIAQLDTLLQATFLDMFGDPVTNPKGWPTVSLEKLCAQIVDCPHSTPKYSENRTGYYCVRSSDIQGGRIELSEARYVSPEVYAERIVRHEPEVGEVVYTREGGRLGLAGRVPPDSKVCLGQRMMLFHAAPDLATNTFIWGSLNSPAMYKKVVSMSGGGAAPRVNIKQIKGIEAISPPLVSVRP